MKYHIAVTSSIFLTIAPCAVVLQPYSTAQAAEYALFPGSRNNDPVSQIPKKLPPLAVAEIATPQAIQQQAIQQQATNQQAIQQQAAPQQAASQTESSSASTTVARDNVSSNNSAGGYADRAAAPGQPLRVVIPNINPAAKKKIADANQSDKDNLSYSSSGAASAAAADNSQSASASSASSSSSYSSSSSSTSTASSSGNLPKGTKHFIPESARQFWNNGVMLSDWSDTIVIRAMLKPSIAFLPLPQEWNLSAYASNNTIDNSANNTADNSANSSINNSAAKFAAVKGGDLAKLSPAAGDATAEIAADDVAVSAGQKTALSSESKDILNKMPPLADSKKLSSSKKKVDINRAREVGDVLTSADNAASSPEALGVKLGSARSQFDVNYELERAYNALIAGNSEVAIQIYEDILTGNPQNKEALFGLASTYHRSGQLDLARSLYGKLLQLDPKNRDGLNNFLVLLAEEAPQEALAQMEKLETQNPEFSPIPAQMAIIYQKLGNSDKAIDKMYRALAIAPENMTYRYNLAVMLDGSGKFDDASKLYAQILSSHAKGEVIPGDAAKIQQRLTFIRSNNARTSLLGAVR